MGIDDYIDYMPNHDYVDCMHDMSIDAISLYALNAI